MSINKSLSTRLEKINPSSTLAITSKAKKLKSEGKDIVSLSAGEPDFDTPDFIKDAACEAIRNGCTKYTPTTGTAELKKLICEKFKKDNSLDYNPNQIVVSCGAKHSIFNALFVLINRGDEVLIPTPYWVSYPEMVNLCEGRARFINTLAENYFKIIPKDLEKSINPKTKALILNSPSNPAGSVYGLDELGEIAKICVANKIFVISDEIYEKIIFDGLTHVSIGALNKAIYDLTIAVNGVSKSYSMTGWRIGYMGARADIVEAISRLQDHSTSNPSSISQKAACAALSANEDFSKKICQEFQRRRDYCVSRLKRMDRISFPLAQGAFYIFCDISRTSVDSVSFCERLLDEAYVSLIPGSGFGMDNYVRISFSTDLEQLEKGMDRLEKWLDKL
jgi:aspartate aminotransferase